MSQRIPYTDALKVLALTLVTHLPSTTVFASQPLPIGSNKQLFIGPFDENRRDTELYAFQFITKEPQ